MQLSKKTAERYTRNIGAIADAAKRDLAVNISSLPWDSDVPTLEANRNYVIAKLWQIADKYGTAAAAHALDYFEGMTAGYKGRTAARSASTLAETAPLEQVNATVRFAAGALFNDDGIPDVDAFANRCAAALDRMVVGTASRTIAENGRAAGVPVKYCRICEGDDSCRLCRELADRGFVWYEDDFFETHDGCQCGLVAAFGDNPTLV